MDVSVCTDGRDSVFGPVDSNMGGMGSKAIDKLAHIFGPFKNEVNVDEHGISEEWKQESMERIVALQAE